MEKDEILDIYGISRYLLRSPDTIRRLIKQKRLPHYRVGKRLYTKKSTLEKWIQAQIKASVEEHNGEC